LELLLINQALLQQCRTKGELAALLLEGRKTAAALNLGTTKRKREQQASAQLGRSIVANGATNIYLLITVRITA
jgi:uncharacterized protein YhfF